MSAVSCSLHAIMPVAARCSSTARRSPCHRLGPAPALAARWRAAKLRPRARVGPCSGPALAAAEAFKQAIVSDAGWCEADAAMHTDAVMQRLNRRRPVILVGPSAAIVGSTSAALRDLGLAQGTICWLTKQKRTMLERGLDSNTAARLEMDYSLPPRTALLLASLGWCFDAPGSTLGLPIDIEPCLGWLPPGSPRMQAVGCLFSRLHSAGVGEAALRDLALLLAGHLPPQAPASRNPSSLTDRGIEITLGWVTVQATDAALCMLRALPCCAGGSSAPAAVSACLADPGLLVLDWRSRAVARAACQLARAATGETPSSSVPASAAIQARAQEIEEEEEEEGTAAAAASVDGWEEHSTWGSGALPLAGGYEHGSRMRSESGQAVGYVTGHGGQEVDSTEHDGARGLDFEPVPASQAACAA